MAMYSLFEVITKHNVGTFGGVCPLRSRDSLLTHFGGYLEAALLLPNACFENIRNG